MNFILSELIVEKFLTYGSKGFYHWLEKFRSLTLSLLQNQIFNNSETFPLGDFG